MCAYEATVIYFTTYYEVSFMYTQEFRFRPKPPVNAIRVALPGSGIALASGALPAYALSSSDIDALKDQMQILMQRIADLEKQTVETQQAQAGAAEL
jgi:hypothetical protein